MEETAGAIAAAVSPPPKRNPVKMPPELLQRFFILGWPDIPGFPHNGLIGAGIAVCSKNT